jgi:Na+-driven multidrug efflux pump
MNKLKIAAYSAFGVLSATAVSFAAAGDGLGRIECAAACMCKDMIGVLPVVSMLMVIGAGVVYAAGQMMGAETRARANTWATAMLLGAVIAILIVVVAPPVLDIMYANTTKAIGSSLCTTLPTGCTC